MSKTNDAPQGTEAPETHRDPDRWWNEVKYQSRFCLAAIAGISAALIRWGLDEAATQPMTILAIGLVGGAMAYGGGSWCIGFAKAWRAKE